MQTIILIVSFLLTGLLATWAVIRGERDKKAKRLSKKLIVELDPLTTDQIKKQIEEENAKPKVDKVKVLALQYVIEERLKVNEPGLGIVLIGLLWVGYKVILAALMAAGGTAFIGGIIYLLSLVITIIQFNWIFISVVFALFFLGSLSSVFKK